MTEELQPCSYSLALGEASQRCIWSLQVLMGDVEDAICLHAFYYAIWRRYGALPERYNWQLQAPDVLFYPLRPELVESTYLLYQVPCGMTEAQSGVCGCPCGDVLGV